LFGAVGYLERQQLCALLNDTLKKVCTNPRRRVARANTFCMVAHYIMILSIELASGRISGAQNFETPKILENLCTAALSLSNYIENHKTYRKMCWTKTVCV
jgi:hypothetical protein